MTTVDDFVARLKAGESPADALAALISPDLRTLLERCSMLRAFDAELVGFLLDGDADANESIARLLDGAFAEPLPRLRGVYRLREAVRADYFRRWWRESGAADSVPPALAAQSRRLVGYYDVRGDSVEALYHELLADPPAGLARFESLYAQADGVFDLSRCRDLVDVLGARLQFLGSSGGELRNRYRAYLDARGYWIEDWYRSSRYLQPGATRNPLDELLLGTRRVLQLWAPGGMGKTMLLRWLIARRCAPEPERIACARVDFDMIDVVAGIHDPAVVLLELAAQLDEQLDDRPFKDLLRQYGHLRDRLRLRHESVPSASANSFDSTADLGDIQEQVGACLSELPTSQRVLLILDTLEVALVGAAVDRPDALEPLLEALAEVHHRAASVRIILSGRYAPSERLTRFPRLFPDAASLELGDLQDEEARRYLIEKRGLPTGAVLESAVRAAKGRPFKLALIADVVEQGVGLTAAEIDEYEDVDIIYLIERIVQRVEDDVQWLLRYGVVPRVLDFGFVREVMRSHLGEGMSGRTERDNPRIDALPGRVAEKQAFKTGLLHAPGDVDVERSWSKLRLYAGTSAWVNVDRDDPDLLRFHTDVINPMRRIIARHPVFDDLQRDACVYFERKAREDEAHGMRWIREAIFHRFQLEGPRAARYWRERLEEARDNGDVAARGELASEVLGSDYLEDGEPRKWRRGHLLISARTVIEAHFEKAWADVQRAWEEMLPATDSTWAGAEEQLAVVQRRQQGYARAVVPRSRLALVRVPLLLARRSFDEADAELAYALKGRLSRDERLWLLTHSAAAIAAFDPVDALRRLRRALDFATESGETEWRGRILLRLAQAHAALDDLAAALAACDEARTIGDSIELELRRSEFALRAGAVETASEAGRAAAALGLDAARVKLLEARVQLARWQPLRAEETCEEGLAALPGTTPAPDDLATWAALVELRGTARAHLLQVDGALGDFIAAADRWKSAGDPVGAWRSARRRFEFQLHELGDLNEAAVNLEQTLRPSAYAAGPAAVSATALLQAELLRRSGDRAQAQDLIEAAATELADGRSSPRQQIAVELAALTIDPARPLGLLNQALARVTPPSARLVLLDTLDRCPLLRASRQHRVQLRRTVPAARRGAPLPLAFADLELDRALGRADSAMTKLARLGLISEDDPYVLQKWFGAAGRIDADVPERHQGMASALAAVATTAVGVASPLLAAAAVVTGAVAAFAPFKDLLSGVIDVLDSKTNPATAWQARLYEAAARDASERGDTAEERRQLSLAAAVYAQLGDVPAQERLIGHTVSTERPDVDKEEGTTTLIVLTIEGSRIRADARVPPGRNVWSVKTPRFGAALKATPPAFARLASTMLHDWKAFCRELGALLGKGAPMTGDATRDVHLRIEDTVLQSIPWELASGAWSRDAIALAPAVRWFCRTTRNDEPSAGEVRAVQRALRHGGISIPTDGILGPATVAALIEFQRGAGLPATGRPDVSTRFALADPGRLTAAVIRPSYDVGERTYRGWGQSGVPLPLLYSQGGIAVHELESSELGFLGKRPTALVHITASVVEPRGGGVELDFGANPEGHYGSPTTAMGTSYDRVTSSALDLVLRRMACNPVVILDVPASPGPTGLLRQLFLRNAFAAELFALGSVDAVIATGLAPYAAQERIYGALLHGLAAFEPLGQVATRLRQMWSVDESLTDAVAFGAVALFARSGDVRPPVLT